MLIFGEYCLQYNHLRSMKPQKRKSSSEVHGGRDRLSEMPDEIIVHILSYMTTFDAVRTMLIRPFGNLWTLIPSLDFHIYNVFDSNDVRRFFIYARKVMMLHKRPFIDIFHLCLSYDDYRESRSECGDDIRMCLKFALDKQAKVIYFSDLDEDYSDSSDYPNFISKSLVTLKLTHFIIYPELQVDLGSLKELTLDNVTMSEEEFQKFISGCPSLQVLHIDSPTEIRNLSFSAPNIRKLFLRFEEDYPDEEPLVLDFPNLQSLDLDLDGIPDIIHMDVSCVRDVSLSFSQSADSEIELRRFKLFWEKLSQSEVFRLSLNRTSEHLLHLRDDLDLLQIRWKHVVLSLLIFCQRCVLGFYQLIRSSKYLEELDIYINTTVTSSSVFDTPNLFSGELSYPCVMPKLKTVTLHGYAKPWEHQLQLIEFLLKSAIVLEKLVIVPNKCRLTAEEKLDFVIHVSSFQRFSPSARVLFL